VTPEAYEAGVLPLKPGKSERAFELAVLKFLEKVRDGPRLPVARVR
jgi:DNA topoisomerase I